jgi:hypothetical protein
MLPSTQSKRLNKCIARATKTENPYGKFLDSIIGDAINFAFFGFVGVMLFRHPDLAFYQPIDADPAPHLWLIIGSGAAFCCILLQHTESIYDAHLRNAWDKLSNDKNLNYNELVSKDKKNGQRNRSRGLPHLVRLIDRNFRVRETHYFILILAYWLSFIDLFLAFFLVYYSVRFVLAAIMFGRRAQILKVAQKGASIC